MAGTTTDTTTDTTTVPSPMAATDGPADNPYTGVIIIHGFGDIKRNSTMLEALDSLIYRVGGS